MTTHAKKDAAVAMVERNSPQQYDADLSRALMRDIAHQSLERGRAAAADPADAGRSLPLPLPAAADVTIAQALEAAFLYLAAVKKRASGADISTGDPLDWSEELLEPTAHIAAHALAKR